MKSLNRFAWVDGVLAAPQDKKIKFYSRIKKIKGCWEWQGALTIKGYGWATFNGVTRGAHQISAVLSGKIPNKDNPFVTHDCDNKKCIKPDHIRIGNPTTNSYEMFARKRHKVLRGENHARALLNNKQVQVMRKLHKLGIDRFDLATLARVNETVVQGVIYGKNY